MTVRAAVPADLDTLLDAYEAVAAERTHIGAEPPIDREARRGRWLDMIDPSTPGTFLVAEAGGEVVGQLGLTGTARLELGMHVAAGWRGKGAGTALMEAALDYARAHGAYKISLEVWPHNTAAIALYEKFGFEREGYLRKHWRRRNGELWDSVVMGLLLTGDGS
jgi:RimJ/RimL family protein N-acetyltransferase